MMLDAFKLKPFDLEPIYASWTDAPVFTGNPKKDKPVDTWLDQIKEGCIERKVPEEYWHKVAQHYMGPQATARVDEFKRVLYEMHGGSYRWTWKKFRLAMCNMAWEIPSSATRSVEVKSKPSGSWWAVRRKSDGKTADDDTPPPHPPPKKTPSRSKSVPALKESPEPEEVRPAPSRSATLPWLVRRNSKAEAVVKPELVKALSDSIVPTRKPRAPSRSSTMDSIASVSEDTAVTTTIANAPAWLLHASHAIEFLTEEHPKAMTALSAILITAGSIPAMPAIGAGVGGAFLASQAAQAIGSIAIGLGTLIKASQHGQVQAGTSASINP